MVTYVRAVTVFFQTLPQACYVRGVSVLLLCAVCIGISGCNPFYVIRTAYNGAGILLSRQDIQDVVAREDISEQTRFKLGLVLEARDFAKEIGLVPEDSFTTYSEIDRQTVGWSVVASRNDSFTLHTWWFPFVGRVPYKGYFSREAAERAAERFDPAEYDVLVGAIEAYSTLGWFNDPLLSTSLRRDPVALADLVLHELTHNTVWLKNNVTFNESLANYVGVQGAVDFFDKRRQECLESGKTCDQEEAFYERALHRKERTLELGVIVEDIYRQLNELYQSDLPGEEKLKQREAVFEAVVAPLREAFPQMRLLQEINNAEIMQLKIYHTRLNEFDRLYRSLSDWTAFIDRMKAVQEKVRTTPGSSPFELMIEIETSDGG